MGISSFLRRLASVQFPNLWNGQVKTDSLLASPEVSSYYVPLKLRGLAIMSYRKDELSPKALDRDFPFQVALPADLVAGKNYDLILIACAAGLAVCQTP